MVSFGIDVTRVDFNILNKELEKMKKLNSLFIDTPQECELIGEINAVPNLTHLCIMGCSSTSTKNVIQSPNLKNLEVFLSEIEEFSIFSNLEKNTSITNLSVRAVEIETNSLHSFFEYNTNLLSLNLTGNFMGNSFTMFCKQLSLARNLKTLNICSVFCEFHDGSFQFLENLLKYNIMEELCLDLNEDTLGKLRPTMFQNLEQNTSLKMLTWRTALTESEAQIMAKFITKNSNLKHISLGSPKSDVLSFGALKQIKQALMTNNNITEVYLYNTEVNTTFLWDLLPRNNLECVSIHSHIDIKNIIFRSDIQSIFWNSSATLLESGSKDKDKCIEVHQTVNQGLQFV